MATGECAMIEICTPIDNRPFLLSLQAHWSFSLDTKAHLPFKMVKGTLNETIDITYVVTRFSQSEKSMILRSLKGLLEKHFGKHIGHQEHDYFPKSEHP